MQKIKKLTPLQIQKIAAGEVVERPANVLKELIENSLDADSNNITIYIEDGGKKKIRIIDNGYGMSLEDARLCIEDHATSKITSIEELTNIGTFGFRGEALASIAAVSHLTITTKEREAKEHDSGIKLEVYDAKIQQELPVSANYGTDISIENLFYNLPARKKFLKAKETEWRQIVQIFTAFCLDYIGVTFKLYHEDKLVYNFPKVDSLELRAAQVFDYSISTKLLSFAEHQDRMNLKISGVVSDPSYNKYDRSDIYIFVNKRWVKNYKLANALIKGFQNMLPSNKYPMGVLFIEIDSNFVDINIHPKKEEVQFLHPGVVETAIENCIRNSLEKYQTDKLGIKQVAPVFTEHIQKTNLELNNFNFEEPVFSVKHIEPVKTFSDVSGEILAKTEIKIDRDIKIYEPKIDFIAPEYSEPKVINIQNKIIPDVTFDYKLVGQIFNTYILIETETGLTVIDQHSAHERIVYERLKNNFDNNELVSLLFGQIINLEKQDLEIILPYLDFFKSLGISLEQAGENKLLVNATSVVLRDKNISEIIKEALSWIKVECGQDLHVVKKIVLDKVHAKISCVSAVKAGDSLTTEQMHTLIKDLYKTENKLTCPHGRPTIWPLDLLEIEKKFKRDYKS